MHIRWHNKDKDSKVGRVKMDNRLLRLGFIGVVILLISIMAITGMVNARSSDSSIKSQGADLDMKENIIKVTGSGSANIKPDVAYLNVGVQTIDKDAKKAQDDNRASISKMIDKLKAMKIKDEDIQTSSYDIRPRYNYNNNKETLEGYEVENMIRVTVREVEAVGDILDAMSKEGANRSHGISFDVLDREEVYNQALEKAIDDAKNKADVMSKKAEVTLQKPLAIYEGYVPDEVYGDDIFVRKEMVSMDADMMGSSPIASGELEIKANVTIIYGTK